MDRESRLIQIRPTVRVGQTSLDILGYFMRSTETSGVGAKGFDVPRNRVEVSTMKVDIASRLRRVSDQLSPVTLAVAVTAFMAATLFVVVDAMRTLDELQARVDLIARALSAELATLDPQAALAILSEDLEGYGPGILATLHTAEGQMRAASPSGSGAAYTEVAAATEAPAGAFSREMPAGALGTLSVAIDEDTAFTGVWQRGIGAFSAAFLMVALAFRRRDPATPGEDRPQDHFGDLISTIPFGVACWSAEGQLIACNDHYNATLDVDGWKFEPGSSYHSAVKQLVHGGYMRLVSEDEKSRLLELHRQDGSCLLIDERPLVEGGFVTFVTDVTERKRTDVLLNSIREEQRLLARRYHEEKLRAEAASRSKTSFLAHLSHDIRTPLNHIIGFADLIRHQTYGPLGDDRYLNYVETIKASGERLLASFATILDLAELESGQKTLREEQFSVDDLVVATTRRFSGQAARAGLTLSIGAACDATLTADRFCLERMLGNIVENAIRFTPSGGKVTLAAFAAHDGVVLEVSDTGLGMTEEQLENLAQPFVLGDSAFTREHGGTGLGIAIARAIAELSGGRLAIDSSPALGTTVAISLPLRSAQDATGAHRAA